MVKLLQKWLGFFVNKKKIIIIHFFLQNAKDNTDASTQASPAMCDAKIQCHPQKREIGNRNTIY